MHEMSLQIFSQKIARSILDHQHLCDEWSYANSPSVIKPSMSLRRWGITFPKTTSPSLRQSQILVLATRFRCLERFEFRCNRGYDIITYMTYPNEFFSDLTPSPKRSTDPGVRRFTAFYFHGPSVETGASW